MALPEFPCDDGVDNDCDEETEEGCVAALCGDGYCAGFAKEERCGSCPADCPGKTTGQPKNMYCCGNGMCESFGENVFNCPTDCLV